MPPASFDPEIHAVTAKGGTLGGIDIGGEGIGGIGGQSHGAGGGDGAGIPGLNPTREGIDY